MSQARNWCFTINNPSESPDELIELFKAEKRVRYLVFQREKGDEETIHYQGYCEFSSPVKLGGVKKIHARAHWEVRRGTREQARDYCVKEDSRIEGPWEFGEWGQTRGQRTDLEALYKAARTMSTLQEVAEAFPASYMRHYKAVRHVRQLKAFDKPKREKPLEVFLYYGPPGTGKTRRAYEEAPDLYAIPLGKQLWFDNYAGEPIVLIDDFSGSLRLVDTLRMFDRYPIQVPVKGDFVWWCPERIYVTSNVHPRNWYNYSTRADSYAALTRRFTKVIHFPDDKVYQTEEEVEDFFNNVY